MAYSPNRLIALEKRGWKSDKEGKGKGKKVKGNEEILHRTQPLLCTSALKLEFGLGG